jgi:predicted transport protein
MPFFEINEHKAKALPITEFKNERDLQVLVQNNLDVFFGCRLVAEEFSTGGLHMGRIDTLALDEDNGPVIIEYKVVESSDLINQSLFYVSWLEDHHADFEQAVAKIYPDVEVDWSDIRVICLAPGFKKYDLHAVSRMGANIQLWRYQRHTKKFAELKKVFPLESSTDQHDMQVKGSARSGFKASETRRYADYNIESHLSRADESIRPIFDLVRAQIMSLDESVQEAPKKFYIAYKVTSNFVCIEFHRRKITLFLKLKPQELAALPPNGRDVSKIGHYGTGDLELELTTIPEAEACLSLIKQSFDASNMV